MNPHKKIKSKWPETPTTPHDRLLHTLDAYEDEPDNMWVIRATSGIYEEPTGIQLGDLRILVQENMVQ